MKIFLLITALVVNLTFTDQDRTANVKFNGYNEDGYSFVTITNDANTAENLHFTEVRQEWIDQFAFNDENTKGQQFTITYSISKNTVTDELGNEENKIVYSLLSVKRK